MAEWQGEGLALFSVTLFYGSLVMEQDRVVLAMLPPFNSACTHLYTERKRSAIFDPLESFPGSPLPLA